MNEKNYSINNPLLPKLGKRAIVIGGSLAGLLTARVLTNYFENVTIIERDQFPESNENRKGVPQGRHAHGLLAKGREIISRLFPDIITDLVEGGATLVDVAGDMMWYHFGGKKARVKTGIVGPIMSRPFLESHIRRRVLALANVICIQACDVRELVATPDGSCVTGIKIKSCNGIASERILNAELIIDASGRGSQSLKWLEALGYEQPEEISIKMNAGYTSRMYRRRPEDTQEAKSFFILPEPPHQTRMGGAFAVEGDRWHISLGGWIGDHAPADEAGFLEFARSLPTPEIYNIIKCREPLSDFSVHKFPANQRRLYEKMRRFPEGYLVIGDAICSFNPIYGQGMSISAMEADALDRLLKGRKNLRGLWKKFFKQTAKVVDVAWMMSASEDFRYPEVNGKKPLGTAFINWYMGKLHRAATRDPEVCRAFFKMMNLLHPPTLAFDPRIIFRVLRDSFKLQQPKPKLPMRPAPAQE